MPVSLTSSEFYIRNDSITLIQGADSLNVLDRMVSTKISEIQDLSRKDALFCDFNGRISDVALIHSISGKILITSSNSQSEETRRKLVDGVSWDEDCELFVADEAIFRITIFPTDAQRTISNFLSSAMESETDFVPCRRDMFWPTMSISDPLYV